MDYNKFRQNIQEGNYFRKAHNTLNQINDFDLPAMAVASAIDPVARLITNMLQKAKI